MNEERKIKLLLDLIDDENEHSACMAMAELLKTSRTDLVRSQLCDLQESANLRVRRRVHQLQTAIQLRSIRADLASDLKDGSVPLLDGVMQLHMYWFDNDTPDTLIGQWNQLCTDFSEAFPPNLAAFGDFMMNRGFRQPVTKEIIEPEHFCIGCAMDNMPASDLLLAIISKCLTAGSNAGLRIVRSGFNFGVSDFNGDFIFPGEDWRYVPAEKNQDFEWSIVSDAVALQTLTSLLFQCAAASDGFRYMYTLGRLLAISGGNEDLEFLPYPFNTK